MQVSELCVIALCCFMASVISTRLVCRIQRADGAAEAHQDIYDNVYVSTCMLGVLSAVCMLLLAGYGMFSVLSYTGALLAPVIFMAVSRCILYAEKSIYKRDNSAEQHERLYEIVETGTRVVMILSTLAFITFTVCTVARLFFT